MKKSVIAMVLILALIMSGCQGESPNSTPDAENAPSITAVETVSPTAAVPEDSQPIETNTPDVVESDIPQPAEDMDRWGVTTYNNKTPFSPENYDGQVIDYVTDHISSDGTITQVTYEDVAFISDDDKSYDEKYGNYKNYYTTQIDGKDVHGYILWTIERFDFLEHCHDGSIDRFLLDIDLPSDLQAFYYDSFDYQVGVRILAQNDSKVIMSGGPYLFTYEFQTAKTHLISDSVLDYKYSAEGELFFTDWDHVEHAVDWENDDTITETGNEVFSYHNEDFESVILDDFEEEFLAMQEALRNGEATEATYAQNYYIFDSGLILSVPDHEFISNIHLPKPYSYNSYLTGNFFYSCWQIEEHRLILYRFGDVVKSYELPEGKWKILETDMSQPYYSNTKGAIKIAADVNNDGQITAKELDDAIVHFNVVLMNVDESAIYHLDESGNFELVLTDVVDYYNAYGRLYCMDSLGNVYEYDWSRSRTNTLIGKNAIGLAPIVDDAPGFLVKPDGSQSYTLYQGWPVADDWLS